MSDNNEVDKIVNVSLSADKLEVRVLLHIVVLHVDACIEDDCSVFDADHYAGTTNLLACT
jgi:hypothetical protein